MSLWQVIAPMANELTYLACTVNEVFLTLTHAVVQGRLMNDISF